MTAFAIFTGVLVAGVVAFITWPLWRSRREGKSAAVRITTGGWIALACTPALVAVAYVLTGSPATAPAPAPAAAAPAGKAAPHGLDQRQVAANVERLSAKLRENPEDGPGWATLGKSLAALGRFREGADALGEAERRMPGNATLLADRADILAMAQGRKFTGEPDRLIQAALQADPRHLKALALAGLSAFDRGDYATAALHWRRYLSLMQPGDPAGREVEERAREAERRATAGGARSLNGTVTFPAGQALTLEPGAVVFVVARAGDGRGRPVAVSRVPVSALPVNFRLDDGDSLSPAAPLSGFSEIVLEARLSRNGIAEARPGDPRSSPRAAKPGERAIVLELGARPG